MNAVNRLNPSRPIVWGWPVHVLLAAALGAGLGALVTYDPAWSPHFPTRALEMYLYRQAPYLWTILALAALAGLLLLARRAAWLVERRYEVAVVILMVAQATSGVNVGPLDPTDVAGAFLVLFWLSITLVEHRPIVVPLGVLVLVSIFGFFALGSIVNGLALTAVRLQTIFSKIVILLVLCSIIGANRGLMLLALRAFIGVTVVSAVLGIVFQCIFLTTGMPISFTDVETSQFKETPLGMMLRTSALLTTSQVFAHEMLLGACLLLCAPGALGLRLAAVALCGVGVAFTFSTGAYMTFAFAVLLAPFVVRPKYTIHVLSAYVAAGLITYLSGLYGLVMEKVVEPLGSANFWERVEYLRLGLNVIETYPWLGIGLGKYGSLNTPIHNAYVQCAADIGLVGGAVFVVFLAYLVVRTWGQRWNAAREDDRRWLAGLLLGMLALCVHYTSEPFYDNVTSWVFFGLVSGGLVALGQPWWKVGSPQ